MAVRVDAPKLNIIGEFRDPAQEHTFFHGYVLSVRHFIAWASLLVGALYLLLGFFELFAFRYNSTIVPNLTLRGCVFLCAVGVFFTARGSKSASSILYTYLTFAVILVVSYQCMLYGHYQAGEPQSFMELSIAFLVIVLICFLLPNRWIYSVAFSLGVSVMFLGLTAWYMVEVPLYQTLGVSLYFAFVVLLGAMFSRSLQVQRRLHYYRVRQLEHLSSTDRLTGIYNRQKFDEVFADWLARAGDEAGSFSVIMFDLDDFKRLNDSYGHMVGDEVLVSSVRAVREAIRSRDIFARWGGEEFMILLPGTPLPAAVSLAERLRHTVEGLRFPVGAHVTASFGVTQHQPGDTSDAILARVDGYLYRAKQEGKNRVWAGEAQAPPEAGEDSPPEAEGQISLWA